MADNSIYGGLFNFQDIMRDFYSDQNKSDEQRIMKSAFQGNFIQSGLNQQLSSQMAQTQAALSKDQMKLAADLELRNQMQLGEQNFKFSTQMMDQQYDLQDNFADNQNKRDIVYLGAKGEDSRKSLESAGIQDRLSKITQGEQDRLNTQQEGSEQRLTDTNKIATEGAEQRQTDTNRVTVEGEQARETDTNRITTEGTEERKTVVTQGEQTRATDTNRITTEASEQRATDTNRITTEGDEKRKTVVTEGEQQRATDTNKITTEGSEQRLTDTNRISTEGDQERKTLDKKDDLDAKKENRATARSRSLARAF